MVTLERLRRSNWGVFDKIRSHPSPNQSSRDGHLIKLAVVHTTESADDSYEAVCDYLSRKGVEASSHYVIDCQRDPKRHFTKVSRLVPEGRKAWTSRSANAVSVNYELVGRASRTRADWLEKYRAQIRTLAALVASDVIQYGLPIKRAYPGICGHGDLNRFGFPNDHTDPGAGFPWDVFLEEVESFVNTGVQKRTVKKVNNVKVPDGTKLGCNFEKSGRVSRALGRLSR